MKKKKVLFVVTKSNFGGAQRYVFDLATHLPKDRFEPIVLCGPAQGTSTAGALIGRLAQAGIRTIFVKELSRDVSGGGDFATYRCLSQYMREEKPDVVHLNSSKAAGLGALAARFAGVPKIIFTVHGWPFLERRNVFSRALIWFFSWLTAILVHTTIVISNYDLHIAQQMPFVGRKAVLIYNGIEPDMWFGSGEIIRKAFPAGVRITGTIGEVTKNKNQQALIEEAKVKPEMHVAIVGEGELHDYLERKITEYKLSERVKLFGFIPASEALKGFDTFALPSLKEGLPYVLLEAKAAGLPIIANRVGGVSEILDAKDMSKFSLERMVKQTVQIYLPAQTG
jgi:glycosyltransferase involved in cell wall biosynthesis